MAISATHGGEFGNSVGEQKILERKRRVIYCKGYKFPAEVTKSQVFQRRNFIKIFRN